MAKIGRVIRYDEVQLVQALSAETKAVRAAFAAASAERLQPLYEWFHEACGQGDPATLRAGLDAVWELVRGLPAPDGLPQLQQAAESLVPDEDDDWAEQSAYAQNAAAAVTYALGSWIDDDPQQAGWAARQLYEAADYAAQQEIGDLNSPGAEAALLARPVVQEALEGIQEDLRAVSRPGDPLQIAQEVRDAGRAGGAQLAGLVIGA